MNDLLARIGQPILTRIIELLPVDEPIYLVGGAIRDALLNRPSNDLDFVTPGDALKIARQIANNLGAAYFPLDVKRKMARLIIKPPRAHSLQAWSSTRIDFSTFQGDDLINDLQGRDFTMNAMAVEVHNFHTLIDPLGGATDLISKYLRPCSQHAFLDDPVRILRAVRFSVDLNLQIQTETLQLLRQSIKYLSEVSAERLRDEIYRILLQSHPSSSLRILDKLNALEYILPELCLLKGVEQSTPHIMDVWDHTLNFLTRLENLLEVLAPAYNPDKAGNLAMGFVAWRLGRYRQYLEEHLNNALNPDRPHRGLIFLAGMYHDVGKLHSQSMVETGKIQFINHEQIGSQLIEKRGQELKLSNLEIERVVTIVRHHMRPSMLSHLKETPSRKAVYRFFRDTGAAGVDICVLSLADILATYGTTLPQERWERHLDVVRQLWSAWWEDQTGSVFPPPLINGDILMDELNISPGPLVGYLLESIREAQVAGDIHNQQEAINLAQKLLANH